MSVDHAEHGGPDAAGGIVWDFSTNANAVALPADLLTRLLDADRRQYPDPAYTALRSHLARQASRAVPASQALVPERILPMSGSSEGIRRLTLAAMLKGVREAWVPAPAYGDYAQAARALGLQVRTYKAHVLPPAELEAACSQGPVLAWLCEPGNPSGQCMSTEAGAAWLHLARSLPGLVLAVDHAYAPMRWLTGDGAWLDGDELAQAAWQRHAWHFHTPNKALGLTGVRAAWAQAPHAGADALGLRASIQALAPSWVLSAEGVSLLVHWHDDDVQQWLAQSLKTLKAWHNMQSQGLQEFGWACEPTLVPFMLARPPQAGPQGISRMLQALRQQGIKLRDATSFGLPGMVRLRVHAPEAQAALWQALQGLALTSPTKAMTSSEPTP